MFGFSCFRFEVQAFKLSKLRVAVLGFGSRGGVYAKHCAELRLWRCSFGGFNS